MSLQGPNSLTSGYNQDLVSYPSGAGYYIATARFGETYGTNSGSVTAFGQKYTNNYLKSVSGGPFQGVQFPPFYAPARITGVYIRTAPSTPGSLTPVSSPFDNTRTFVGGGGSSVSILRDNFDGPTVLLDVDSNGDITFVLNADALNYSLDQVANPGATFTNSDLLVECTLFGFDRGFLQTNGRLCVVSNPTGGLPLAQDAFTNDSATGHETDGIGIIAPAPLSKDFSNNELTIYYSREPYQGDTFGTQNAYADDAYRLGPLTIAEATGIFESPLGPVSTLSLPNKIGFEVLAASSFITSLGTGRLSGAVPTPLMDTAEAPNNPPDVSGSPVDLARRFSINRVGFEDWATTKFPVSDASVGVRPPIVGLTALSEQYDNDATPEFAGCVARLPLGAYFREKDFVGKTLWQQRSTSDIGAVALGTLPFVNFEASMQQGVAGASTWEGIEFVCGNASGTAGVGTESIIKVDGTSSTTSTTVFKTTRGGAAYSATGPWPGGVMSSRLPKARPNSEVGSVLMATAYLVRSQPESVGMSEIHMGSELQLVIMTHGVPAYFRDTDMVHSAAGTNEGYTAVDRYRILGKPLEKRRGYIDTSVVPSSRPTFVNNIYDNPLYYGSSDVPTIAQKQEILPVTTDGQISFTLSTRPLDPTAVQLYFNGVKLAYGTNYTVGGVTNQNLVYIVSGSNPAPVTTDVVEVFYLEF